VVKIRSVKHSQYISFKESSPNIKVCALHINKMNNVETQFKLLFNTKVGDRVKFKWKIRSLQDILLGVKMNKAPLFVGVE